MILSGGSVASRSVNGNRTSLSLIEALIVREMEVMEAHQYRAASAEDQKLKLLFSKLAETHAQSVTELQSYLNETESQDEITKQINEIFL